ncbi:MAG: hypothetical protein IAE82_07525 [Opitutaceae bacterium]|nr:hypothetical protein [Opitutaceae bacterium]
MPAWFWLCFVALAIVSAVCNIVILITAFRAGILWGLGSLFVPFVSFVFVLLHWHDTKKPFLIGVGAAVATVVLIFKTGLSLGVA